VVVDAQQRDGRLCGEAQGLDLGQRGLHDAAREVVDNLGRIGGG
jgi:hypothetical protein